MIATGDIGFLVVEAGHDPATPLEAYRGDTLCLRVNSIGRAARLEANGEVRVSGHVPSRDGKAARVLSRKPQSDGLWGQPLS